MFVHKGNTLASIASWDSSQHSWIPLYSHLVTKYPPSSNFKGRLTVFRALISINFCLLWCLIPPPVPPLIYLSPLLHWGRQDLPPELQWTGFVNAADGKWGHHAHLFELCLAMLLTPLSLLTERKSLYLLGASLTSALWKRVNGQNIVQLQGSEAFYISLLCYNL